MRESRDSLMTDTQYHFIRVDARKSSLSSGKMKGKKMSISSINEKKTDVVHVQPAPSSGRPSE